MLNIRPFSFPDIDSILQIENQSFPKSPYDWTTFFNLYFLYPKTFLVYVNLSTPRPEILGLPSTRAQAEGLRVDPERRLPHPLEGRDLGAVERVNTSRVHREEEIWGYIIFTLEGHIISIAVHPQHRRKGIGRELLQQVMKNSHLKKVWAEVRRSNQGAQTFYAKLGFQIAGVVPSYYGNEDALIVQWTPAMHKSD